MTLCYFIVYDKLQPISIKCVSGELCNLIVNYMPNLNIKGNKLRKMMWVATIRSIWHYRNSIVFRNEQRDGEIIFGIVQLKAWTWLRNKISKANFVRMN